METSDLVGSFKPINIKLKFHEIKTEFEGLFEATFSIEENKKFINHINVINQILNYLLINFKTTLDMLQNGKLETFSKTNNSCKFIGY